MSFFGEDYKPDNVTMGTSEEEESRTNSILRIREDEEIVFKIIPIPVQGKDKMPRFQKMFFFDYKSGKKFYSRPALDKNDPQMNLYTNFKKMIGDDKDAQDWIKCIKPSVKYFLLVVTPNGSKIEVLQTNYTVISKLFGYVNKSGTTINGIVNNYLKKGMNPFNPRDKKGWIRIKRTGSGLDTEYSVSIDKTVTLTDEGEEKASLKEYSVNDVIFNLSKEDIPIPTEVVKSHPYFNWPLEDINEVVSCINPKQFRDPKLQSSALVEMVQKVRGNGKKEETPEEVKKKPDEELPEVGYDSLEEQEADESDFYSEKTKEVKKPEKPKSEAPKDLTEDIDDILNEF